LLLHRDLLPGLEELGPGFWAAYNLPSCHAFAIPPASLAVIEQIKPCSSQMFWVLGCRRLQQYLFGESKGRYGAESWCTAQLLVQSHKAEK